MISPRLTMGNAKPKVEPCYQYLDKERQWLLIDAGSRKLAILHCYLACVSTSSDGFLAWNRDLYLMMAEEVLRLRRLGFVCLALGKCLQLYIHALQPTPVVVYPLQDQYI